MRWACGSMVVLLVTSMVMARATDDPFYESSVEGTIDMVDYVHRTVSMTPLRPIGETFRLANNCKVILNGKEVEFARLQPGDKVALAYNQRSSTIGGIIAIPADRLPALRIEKKTRNDPPQEQVTGLRSRSYVRIDAAASPGMLTIRATR